MHNMQNIWRNFFHKKMYLLLTNQRLRNKKVPRFSRQIHRKCLWAPVVQIHRNVFGNFFRFQNIILFIFVFLTVYGFRWTVFANFFYSAHSLLRSPEPKNHWNLVEIFFWNLNESIIDIFNSAQYSVSKIWD